MLIKLMLSIDAQCLWESMGQWVGPEVLSKRLSPFLHANMVTDTYMETITFIYYRFCNSFLFPLFSTKCAALYNHICPSGINKVFFPDSDLILITEQYIVQYSIHCLSLVFKRLHMWDLGTDGKWNMTVCIKETQTERGVIMHAITFFF